MRQTPLRSRYKLHDAYSLLFRETEHSVVPRQKIGSSSPTKKSFTLGQQTAALFSKPTFLESLWSFPTRIRQLNRLQTL